MEITGRSSPSTWGSFEKMKKAGGKENRKSGKELMGIPKSLDLTRVIMLWLGWSDAEHQCKSTINFVFTGTTHSYVARTSRLYLSDLCCWILNYLFPSEQGRNSGFFLDTWGSCGKAFMSYQHLSDVVFILAINWEEY